MVRLLKAFQLAILALIVSAMGQTSGWADDAAPGAECKIVNPASTGVTFGYLLDGQTQSLAAGYAQEVAAGTVIKFERGNNAGTAEYTLGEGTYSFASSGGHWDLLQGDPKSVAQATNPDRTVTDTSSSSTAPAPASATPSAPSPLTDEERAEFKQMYTGAGLTIDELKTVADHWTQSSHAERKSEYDSFTSQLNRARGGSANSPSASASPSSAKSEVQATDDDKMAGFSELARATPSGKQVWRWNFFWNAERYENLRSYAVAKDKATVVAIIGRSVVCIDNNTGTINWWTRLPHECHPSEISYSEDSATVVARQADGTRFEFGASDGKTDTLGVTYPPVASPVQPKAPATDSDHMVAVSSLARVTPSGKQVWRENFVWDTERLNLKVCAISEDKSTCTAIFGRSVICFDHGTGKIIWWTKMPADNQPGSIKYYDGDTKLIAKRWDGTFYEFDALDGKTSTSGAEYIHPHPGSPKKPSPN